MLPFQAKLLMVALGALAIGGAIWHVSYTYQKVGEQQAAIASLASELQTSEARRQQESQLAASMVAISTKYQKELSNAKTSLGNALVRLRNTSAASNLPPDSSVASRCDAAAISDILEQYGEKFYRDAARADEVTNQLIAAQELLKKLAASELASTDQR